MLQVSPSAFSGTYSVKEVLDPNTFVVPKDAGAEFTQALSNASYQQVDTQNIFAVKDAIAKMEAENETTSEVQVDTITGLILTNPTLRYTANGAVSC